MNSKLVNNPFKNGRNRIRPLLLLNYKYPKKAKKVIVIDWRTADNRGLAPNNHYYLSLFLSDIFLKIVLYTVSICGKRIGARDIVNSLGYLGTDCDFVGILY